VKLSTPLICGHRDDGSDDDRHDGSEDDWDDGTGDDRETERRTIGTAEVRITIVMDDEMS